MRRVSHQSRFFWAMMLAGQSALVTALLWPALLSAPHTLPTTTDQTSITVPLFNAWTIWWNSDRLGHGLADYWDAPIFYPETGTFAFSDPQPATMAVAPCVWLTRSPVLAYHAYFWINLFLNGAAAAFCLRSFHVAWFLAFAGACAVVLEPIVWDNLDVIQLVPLWGMLLAIRSLIQFHRLPRITCGVAIAGWSACVFSTSVHHGLFFVVSLLPVSLLLLFGSVPLRRAVYAACAALTFVVITAPLILPMAAIHARQRFQRSQATQAELSATIAQWSQVPSRGLLGVRDSTEPRALNPGWIRVGLALAAIVTALRSNRNRRPVLVLSVIAASSWALSFGMNLSLGAWPLWPSVERIIPPLESARSLFRFAYVTQLTILILATLGADALVRLLKRSIGRVSRGTNNLVRIPRLNAASLGATLAMGIALCVEVPQPELRLIGVPDTNLEREWLSLLKSDTAGGPVLCLPFASGFSEAGLEASAKWMLYATQHKHPILNGYSGFFPASWYANTARFQPNQPSSELARWLLDAGVSTIVVDTSAPGALKWPGDFMRIDEFEFSRRSSDGQVIQVWHMSLQRRP